MSNQVRASDFYKITKRLLSLLSVWIIKENSYWDTIKRMFAYIFSISFFTSITVNMYLSRNSIENFIDASNYFFTLLAYILKLLCFRLNYKKFKIFVLRNHKLEESDDVIANEFLDRSNFITKNYFRLCYFTLLSLAVYSLINKVKILHSQGWFPWDTDTIYGRIPALCFQMGGFFYAISISGSLDMIMLEIILVSCWQVHYFFLLVALKIFILPS